jgi:hypothetical protein
MVLSHSFVSSIIPCFLNVLTITFSRFSSPFEPLFFPSRLPFSFKIINIFFSKSRHDHLVSSDFQVYCFLSYIYEFSIIFAFAVIDLSTSSLDDKSVQSISVMYFDVYFPKNFIRRILIPKLVVGRKHLERSGAFGRDSQMMSSRLVT